MSIANAAHHSMMGAVGKRDIFADWYPRWGTGDLLFALNGIYNQGRDLPHNNGATTWIDIVNGLSLARLSTSFANLKWGGGNRLEFDDKKRAVFASLNLSSVEGFTIEAFGDYGVAWGLLVALWTSTSYSSWTAEVHAFASNTGAHVNINANLPGYFYPSAPSYKTDVVMTVDGARNCKVYFNGALAGALTSSTALSKVKQTKVVEIGGDRNSMYSPNGSNLYGATIYQAALTADEIIALYQANLANYI